MRDTLDLLLHDWLGVEALLQRPRFAEHSLETFASVLDTCERIAREKFAPFNRLSDTQEPRVLSGPDGDRVQLPEATHAAMAAYVESGMLAAAQDHDFDVIVNGIVASDAFRLRQLSDTPAEESTHVAGR